MVKNTTKRLLLILIFLKSILVVGQIKKQIPPASKQTPPATKQDTARRQTPQGTKQDTARRQTQDAARPNKRQVDQLHHRLILPQ
jgi:hypothetical protein